MRRARRLTPLLLALLAGCGDYGEAPPTALGDDADPAVSFASHIQPLFDANCVGCHGDGGNAGLDLRPGVSRNNLVGVNATESSLVRVAPGDPAASWLYRKLTAQQDVGSSMPPETPLAGAQVELFRIWIAEGALDN